MSEMRLRYDSSPGPAAGKLYLAEVQSKFGWGALGHYKTVEAFEELYPHLKSMDEDINLDTHLYYDEELGYTYRLRPITFLKDTN